MQLVIIAGGKGTRLGLKDIPKPMVELANKPLLEHQINLAKNYGINEIFICSGHLSDCIIDYFKDGSDFGVKIHHIVESTPLGTAGCLKALENKINDRFMVFYGDVVMDFDLKSFIDYDKKFNPTATILTHPNDHPFDSDLIETDSDSIVTKLLPKPHEPDKFYQNLVNAAVYIFSSEIFNYIEKDVKQDIAHDILVKLINNNKKIASYNSAEYIKDLGTIERYKKVSEDFISGKVQRLNKRYKRKAIFLDRDGVINENMDTHPTAEAFKLLNGASEAVKKINESEYLAIVVTNQPMIAKGFLSFEELNKIHNKMETLLGSYGAFLNKIYFCPHHPEKGFKGEIKELKTDCECRKPKAGMLLKAAEEFNIDLKNSWMIGDSLRDIEAGKNAGTKTVSIGSNLGADFECENLSEAINYILNKEKICLKTF